MFTPCNYISLSAFWHRLQLASAVCDSSSLECISCFQSISRDGRFTTCSEAKHPYHLDQTCAGITNSTFTTMGSGKREKRRCRTCRSNEPRGRVSGNSQEDGSGVLVQLSNLNEKINLLTLDKESVPTLVSLPANADKLWRWNP